MCTRASTEYVCRAHSHNWTLWSSPSSHIWTTHFKYTYAEHVAKEARDPLFPKRSCTNTLQIPSLQQTRRNMLLLVRPWPYTRSMPERFPGIVYKQRAPQNTPGRTPAPRVWWQTRVTKFVTFFPCKTQGKTRKLSPHRLSPGVLCRFATEVVRNHAFDGEVCGDKFVTRPVLMVTFGGDNFVTRPTLMVTNFVTMHISWWWPRNVLLFDARSSPKQLHEAWGSHWKVKGCSVSLTPLGGPEFLPSVSRVFPERYPSALLRVHTSIQQYRAK